MSELAKSDDALVIDDFEVWVTNRKLDNHLVALNNIDPPVTDFEAARRLAKHFKGYMLAPMAMVDGKLVQAQQKIVTDFSEIGTLSGPSDLYLLDITYVASRPTYDGLPDDAETTPEWTAATWTIRYGVVDWK